MRSRGLDARRRDDGRGAGVRDKRQVRCFLLVVSLVRRCKRVRPLPLRSARNVVARPPQRRTSLAPHDTRIQSHPLMAEGKDGDVGGDKRRQWRQRRRRLRCLSYNTGTRDAHHHHRTQHARPAALRLTAGFFAARSHAEFGDWGCACCLCGVP